MASEIPPFNLSGVLPPFLANPADPAGVSPYRTNFIKLAERFGTSTHRLEILSGLYHYRKELRSAGLTAGFQWLDGSFLEDIERTGHRPPADVDIVTFGRRPPGNESDSSWADFVATNHPLFNPTATKRSFKCDAYFVDLDLPSEAIVAHTRYWFGLFSHKRVSFLWKGLLEIPLSADPDDDTAGYAIIQARGRS